METLQHPLVARPAQLRVHTNILTRFIAWCESQEKNRLGWVAGIITGHGCFFTPLTLLFVMIAGNNFIFWPFVIGGMGMCLISNLAAMPTKITLPLFFFSLLIDFSIIIAATASLV